MPPTSRKGPVAKRDGFLLIGVCQTHNNNDNNDNDNNHNHHNNHSTHNSITINTNK